MLSINEASVSQREELKVGKLYNLSVFQARPLKQIAICVRIVKFF